MTDDTRIRVLFCETCNSIDELPNFSGPTEHDQTLEYLIQTKHLYPSGTPHVGGHLADVAKSEWDNPTYRNKIIAEMNESIAGRGESGLGVSFYETRDTFMDDAMACFKKHHRNPNCNDYHSDKMRLIPDTKELRKEAGLGKPVAGQSLCNFCPVHSNVMQKKRADAGMYN